MAAVTSQDQPAEAELVEAEGPDARCWPGDERIGGLTADLRVLLDTQRLMTGSTPEDVGGGYDVCMSFLSQSVLAVKADLAVAILHRYLPDRG